jgi:glycosyltransferase involved in cell wall biosynthesis
MDESKTILVVIPAHNEATVIGQVIANIPPEVRSMRVKVVVVDDGSGDGTADVARLGGATVIRHLTNLGVGAATRTGFRAATELGADIVVTLDADGQHDPADIEKLVTPIIDEDLEVVIGSRLSDRSGMPWHRLAANLLMNLVTFAVYGRIVPDSQSGFKEPRFRSRLRVPTSPEPRLTSVAPV